MLRSWRTLLLWFLLLGLPSSMADNEEITTPLTSENKDQSTTARKAVKKEAEDDTESAPSRYAIQLTSKNFAENVGDGNVWLIEFYAPWCRHCLDFARSYDNVAGSFHLPANQGFRVGKVDCNEEKALKTRFGIISFPSFFVVDGWNVYEYDKSRTEAALMDFLRGGYKKQDPIPLYTSPMGPMGLLQGMLISVGARIMSIFEAIQDSGVPPLVAGIALSFLAVVGGMFSVVILAILTTPKAKND